MRKIGYIMAAVLLTLALLAGCGQGTQGTQGGQSSQSSQATPGSSTATPEPEAQPITVVSREDGSGTRGAFIELFGIEQKEADGTRKDLTTKEAVIANQTEVVLVSVAGDAGCIGYVSLGSLNDSVKAVDIDGAAATTDNVKSGMYSVSRPFIIATKGDPSGVAADFIGYILSAEGQAVVQSSHYIPLEAAEWQSGQPSGKITVAGSSSVTPLMEKLTEAYAVVNPNAVIEIQMSDSSAGLTAAIDGACDIAMSSRDLKETEAAELTPVKIAIDGIAVVVNKDNPVSNLTKDQVKAIFTGETLQWSDV